jgi:hypothetical protein
VQWRIYQTGSSGKLQFRSWSPSNPHDSARAWITVADHIVNPTTEPAFSLNASSQFGDRIIDIDLRANSDPGTSTVGSSTDLSSVTGRDVEYNFDSAICSEVPSA